jgi:hypothetical protein
LADRIPASSRSVKTRSLHTDFVCSGLLSDDVFLGLDLELLLICLEIELLPLGVNVPGLKLGNLGLFSGCRRLSLRRSLAGGVVIIRPVSGDS